MEKDKRNKKIEPPSNKMVKIQVNPDKTIPGVGKAGDIVNVSELVARNFVSQGLATILEKEN